MRDPDGRASAAIRGQAARRMVAQDARWATDVVLSAQHSHLAPHIGLLLGHHFVRIAYEGALTLRSEDPYVGVPELATLLQEKFAAITARVRHTSKLLDDTKKSFTSIIDEFDLIVGEHRALFMGNAVPIARWLETDLGLYMCGRRCVGATVPIAYRLGTRPAAHGAIDGNAVSVVTEEWGGTLAVLNVASLDDTEPVATMDLRQLPAIVGRDRRSDRYLSGKFEAEFPVGLKMLLLTVEGDINTLATIVPSTSRGHEESVFRLHVVTLFHALSTLRHVRDRYPGLDSTGIRELGQIIDGGAARWLLSKEGKAVRNRCMHYPILDERVNLDPTLPMWGIVEAVGRRSMADVVADASATVSRLAEMLPNWGSLGR